MGYSFKETRMLEKARIEEIIKGTLSEKRFLHTMGVADEARRLAKRWGANEEESYLAGLVHDCAKELSKDTMLLRLEKYGFDMTEELKNCPGLWHGPLGSYIAADELGIDNEEILSAVRWHSTGKPDMTLLEKIIYIADFIEPNRCFDGVDAVRRMAYEDIDRAALCECEMVIVYTIENGKYIHSDTLKTRNDLLMRIKRKNR